MLKLFPFRSLRVTFNCDVLFGLYRNYKEESKGFYKRLNTSLYVVLNSSNSHQLQIKIIASQTHTWNCSAESPHINEHANLRKL